MKPAQLLLMILFVVPFGLRAQSVYVEMLDDTGAYHFTPGTNGRDVSDELQQAVNELKREKNFGVLLVPEGRYVISKTIYIPKAVRIIGYGKNRPEFVLKRNSVGFQDEHKYMFWFTDNLTDETNQPRDAGAGTFYSAISNVDFRIEKGNPKAIALRTHFAQHGFVSHCNFYIGDGHAGIHDLGNEIEDLKFFGGAYGISTSRTSPGWPMMMVDLYFEGQRSAAVISRNTGMSIVSMHVKDAPIAVTLQQGVSDRLFMEDCLFENVGRGVEIGVENEAGSQVNLLNIWCRNVSMPVYFSSSEKSIPGKGSNYVIKNFVHGLIMEDMAARSAFQTVSDIEPLENIPQKLEKVIPSLPAVSTWVSVKAYGAVGDGETDDTPAIKKAMAENQNVYFPTGRYRVTAPLKLRHGTSLIGLHPFATQIVLAESEMGFSGFGPPEAVIESSKGGNDIINGIGINTGAFNYRAVALKWMGSERSMINDVKIVGGHGTMSWPEEASSSHRRRHGQEVSTPLNPAYASGKDLAWDNQYWSLWVTENGGGIFKDIWTASTYASTGLYISNTSTPGRVFAMSLEHHVRQEARLNQVENWKFYAFQFEEEGMEGKDAQTLDINDSRNLRFANLWMYRTIRVNTPRPWGIKVSNSHNIDFMNMRSWTQVLHLPGRTIFDMDKNLIVYPGDFARAHITGREEPSEANCAGDQVEKLGFGFEFATGATVDSKGNVYFCEHQQKRVYKWSAATNSLSIYADYPYKPLSLAVDTEDNLVVICRYDPQPGFENSHPLQLIETLPDNNPYYSGWGNGGWAILAYAISPEQADDMQVLELKKTSEQVNVERVIHPTHRWRGDFEEVATGLAETSFVALDGVTIIPYTFDLGRSVQLMPVTPEQSRPVYVTHEDPKITYRFEVDDQGKLTDMSELVKRGEYGHVSDEQGNLYLAEGEILILNKEGAEIDRITLDERVLSMTWGGKGKRELFVTTATSLYRIKLRGKK